VYPVVIIVLQKEFLHLTRDQRAKKLDNRTTKCCGTKEVAYACKYISGYLIPNSVMVIYAEVGIVH